MVASAVGGSLASLATLPPQLGSVGASGALMGLFAALLIASFRLSREPGRRAGLRVYAAIVLITSLIPVSGTSLGFGVDYAAHIGGVLGGGALSLLMLEAWPRIERIPQLPRTAAGISILGATFFLASAGMAAANFHKYAVALIPPKEMPPNAEGRHAQAATLLARYPKDPRPHLYLADVLISSSQLVAAESEARLALSRSKGRSALLGEQMELVSRVELAVILVAEGKREEARGIARPTCWQIANHGGPDIVAKALAAQHLCE